MLANGQRLLKSSKYQPGMGMLGLPLNRSFKNVRKKSGSHFWYEEEEGKKFPREEKIMKAKSTNENHLDGSV